MWHHGLERLKSRGLKSVGNTIKQDTHPLGKKQTRLYEVSQFDKCYRCPITQGFLDTAPLVQRIVPVFLLICSFSILINFRIVLCTYLKYCSRLQDLFSQPVHYLPSDSPGPNPIMTAAEPPAFWLADLHFGRTAIWGPKQRGMTVKRAEEEEECRTGIRLTYT